MFDNPDDEWYAISWESWARQDAGYWMVETGQGAGYWIVETWQGAVRGDIFKIAFECEGCPLFWVCGSDLNNCIL